MMWPFWALPESIYTQITLREERERCRSHWGLDWSWFAVLLITPQAHHYCQLLTFLRDSVPHWPHWSATEWDSFLVIKHAFQNKLATPTLVSGVQFVQIKRQIGGKGSCSPFLTAVLTTLYSCWGWRRSKNAFLLYFIGINIEGFLSLRHQQHISSLRAVWGWFALNTHAGGWTDSFPAMLRAFSFRFTRFCFCPHSDPLWQVIRLSAKGFIY